MTVKCLSALDKGYIADSFSTGTQAINELAITFYCSRRTIIRVLEEQDIDPGVKHRKPKPMPVVQREFDLNNVGCDLPIDSPYGVDVYDPGPISMAQATPWYRKVLKYVGINA